MRDLRESVMALLSARQQLASKIADGTPTSIPLSDRQAVLQVGGGTRGGCPWHMPARAALASQVSAPYGALCLEIALRVQVLEQAPGQRGGPKELAPVLRMLQKVPFLAELEMQALTEIARSANCQLHANPCCGWARVWCLCAPPSSRDVYACPARSPTAVPTAGGCGI